MLSLHLPMYIANYTTAPTTEYRRTYVAQKHQQMQKLKARQMPIAMIKAPAVFAQQSDDDADIVAYSDFVSSVLAKQVDSVVIRKDLASLEFEPANTITKSKGYVELPDETGIIDMLMANDVKVSVQGSDGHSMLAFVRELVISLSVFAGMWLLFMKAIGNSTGFGLGKSANMQLHMDAVDDTGVKFGDVAGCDEAKAEVQEVVDFLKDPAKYERVGARVPKGCLLVGSPGTGKTLLAKAIAGEAGVPFFYGSASGFIEMYAGIGAKRVRDLFETAKKQAPCIVFIDVIDAIGKARGGGGGSGNDEREQTINQLLTEMDGFEGNTGVIVLAATNRVDVLDEALLRPGRFDRHVTIGLPDVRGRCEILQIHCAKKPLLLQGQGKEIVDLMKIAKVTAGFSGTDLANLANEAAISAARCGREWISLMDFEMAMERIVFGAERKKVVITAEKRRIIAVHEAGHALVALKLESEDQLRKVTIVPRGNAGGVTLFEPNMDNIDSGLYTRRYLENKIMIALGGRAAEEIAFGGGNITTGASGDFQVATRIARKMVTEFGFCGDLGPSSWVKTHETSISVKVANTIDTEVLTLLKWAYTKTVYLLRDHEGVLNKLAVALLEKETLSAEEVHAIVDCK